MPAMMPLGSVARHATIAQYGGQGGRIGRRIAAPGFHQVLAAALAQGRGSRTAAATSGIQQAAFRVPVAVPRAPPAEKQASILPAQSDAALQKAMTLENVPQSWRAGLQFIMAQES